jgi:hypothetical protein
MSDDPPRAFSWLKALPWLVLSVVVAFALAFAAGLIKHGHLEEAGEAFGRFILASPLAGLFISYSSQRDGSKAGLKAAAWVGIVFGAWWLSLFGSMR